MSGRKAGNSTRICRKRKEHGSFATSVIRHPVSIRIRSQWTGIYERRTSWFTWKWKLTTVRSPFRSTESWASCRVRSWLPGPSGRLWWGCWSGRWTCAPRRTCTSPAASSHWSTPSAPPRCPPRTTGSRPHLERAMKSLIKVQGPNEQESSFLQMKEVMVGGDKGTMIQTCKKFLNIVLHLAVNRIRWDHSDPERWTFTKACWISISNWSQADLTGSEYGIKESQDFFAVYVAKKI